MLLSFIIKFVCIVKRSKINQKSPGLARTLKVFTHLSDLLKYLLNKVVLFVKPILERVCGGAFVNKPHHAIKIQQFFKLSIYHSKTELKFVKLFELEFLELQHLSRIL